MTSTTTTSADSLTTLRELVAEYGDANRAAARATQRRDDAIRAAVLAGVPVAQVAHVTGVNRARIYQITGPRA